MPWIDQHCHLPPGDDGAEQVAAARAAGVARMVTVGCTIEQSRQMIEIARAHEGVYATAGIHPHDSSDGVDGLEKLLDDPNVVAVGEAGLDYHYDHSPRDVQADVFRRQIAIAHERDIPLVIHTRTAWDDTFAILDDLGTPRRTVFHCFTGGPDEGAECLARGGLLSFSGIITFPSGQDLRDAAAACPLDRLLVETDSPYLAPVPHRGKQNRPALVTLVGAAVAEAKDCSVGEVEAATWATASAFYGLDES
ncbi:MAG: TatD family hydrolase [Acidimicrobiales bacterium]|jgi:TatD DNase family protein|nr:TatD family hydrolase [Acidimicrobiales bacterium]